MCDKVIQVNDKTLMFVPDCCKNKLMCDKAVDNYAHVLEFALECLKICDKAVNTYPSASQFVPGC